MSEYRIKKSRYGKKVHLGFKNHPGTYCGIRAYGFVESEENGYTVHESDVCEKCFPKDFNAPIFREIKLHVIKS